MNETITIIAGCTAWVALCAAGCGFFAWAIYRSPKEENGGAE